MRMLLHVLKKFPLLAIISSLTLLPEAECSRNFEEEREEII